MHASFMALVEARLAADPGALIYGTTTAPGDGAAVALTAEARRAGRRGCGPPTPSASRSPTASCAGSSSRGWRTSSTGTPRCARDAARAGRRDARRAAARRSRPRATAAPARSSRSAGCSTTSAPASTSSPRSAWRSSTARRARPPSWPTSRSPARRGCALAEGVLALAVEAARAPLEAYSPDLEALWDDEHETAALVSLRALLDGGAPDRQAHQGAVSFRILPRVLGQLRRAQAEAEARGDGVAALGERQPGLHPARRRAPARRRDLDRRLPQRPLARRDGRDRARVGRPVPARPAPDRQAPAAPGDGAAARPRRVDDEAVAHGRRRAGPRRRARSRGRRCCRSAASARTTCPRWASSPGGGPTRSGRCLDAGLAILAALGAQALHAAGQAPPPALAALVDDIREAFPPVDEVRPLGPDGDALTAAFGRLVFAGPVAAAGVGGRR